MSKKSAVRSRKLSIEICVERAALGRLSCLAAEFLLGRAFRAYLEVK